MDIADLAVAPAPEQTLRVLDHDGAVAGDAVALERRLHEAALAQPEVVLAGQETVAQQEAVHAQGVVLAKVRVVAEQHFLDEVGMTDEVEATWAQADQDDIAVLAGRLQEEGEHVATELAQVASQETARRTGRKFGRHGYLRPSCFNRCETFS